MILIGLGVMAVSSISVLAAFNLQNLSVQKLVQQTAASGLQMEVTRSMLDPALCLDAIQNIKIDESKITDPLSIASIKNAAGILVENGKPLSGQVAVQSISAVRITRLAADKFVFDVEVAFNRDLRPIQVLGLPLSTDPASPSTGKIPQSCSIKKPAAAAVPGVCHSVSQNVTSLGPAGPAEVFCNANEYPTLLEMSCIFEDPGGAAYLEPTSLPNWVYSREGKAPGWETESRPINVGGKMGWRGSCYSKTVNVRARVEVECCQK